MSTADLSSIKNLSIDGINLKKLLVNGIYVWAKYDNWVPLSTESNSMAIFNGNLGYREGYRLSSNGAEKAQTDSVVTGFIPCKITDIPRMKGVTWGTSISSGYCYIAFYDANFSLLGTVNRFQMSNSNGVSNIGGSIANKEASSITTDNNGVTTFNIVFNGTPNIAYIRISATGKGADMIVTVNREIP